MQKHFGLNYVEMLDIVLHLIVIYKIQPYTIMANEYRIGIENNILYFIYYNH